MNAFDQEISEKSILFCKKMGVPLPDENPTERLIRRLNERNTKNLYYRDCSFTGEKILSQYHPEELFPVYGVKTWWSDVWDAADYGRDFDFSRPFFEQFAELKNQVPHLALFVIQETLHNSEFTNCTGYLKNCYLISESDYDEDCYYSNLLKNCKKLVDCSICYDCELCYECIDCTSCYELIGSKECKNCSNSYFLQDCIGCRECIGCINQRQKKYMIYNQQYSKEEYFEHKKNMQLYLYSSFKNVKQLSENFFQQQFHKNLQEEHNQNCLGDHLYNSKNSLYCFDSKDLEDCLYCSKVSLGVKDCMDYTSWGDKAELVYYSSGCGDNIYNLRFCSTCTTNVSNCDYCFECTASDHLFGCVGMKRKQYCILNKQYTKEEYKKRVPTIIKHMKETGEWGQFFPKHLSSFGYNETVAMDTFPLTREQALAKGYKWREINNSSHDILDIVIPENIDESTQDVCNTLYSCEVLQKSYKIIPQEYQFYKELHIPIPHRCPEQRHLDRMKQRNPLFLWKRNCSKTGAEIYSSYDPKKEDIICSKEAYEKALYN